MWGFSIGKAFGLMPVPYRSSDFVSLGGGAGIGYMLGSILRDAESDPSGA